MTSLSDATTTPPSSFTRSPYPTATTHTVSPSTSSRTSLGPSATKRHQHYGFRSSLCTAAALGLLLLGHPGRHCFNGQSNSYYCNGVYALPVTRSSLAAVTAAPADTLPVRLQQPHMQQTQPYQQQHRQQQVLALPTSNSVDTYPPVTVVAPGFDGHIRLALPKHASIAAANADTASPMVVENSNNHNHGILSTANKPSTTGMSADMGRVLASELISEPEQPSALHDTVTTPIAISGPKQDEQHLAFLDLMTRVSGKSRDQAEREIWEEQRATAAAVRKELEMRLKLQREQAQREQDRVVTVEEGDSRIELKQVSKLHAEPTFKIKSKAKSKAAKKDHHHKEQQASGTGKGKHGLKGALEKNNKGSIRATSTDGGRGVGGGVKTTPTIFYVPHQDDDALAMALAIREHIEAGRKVIVHLYSDGINALLRDIVSGAAPCTLQHPPHKMELTLQDVVTGRTHEFRQSLRALGVKDEDIFESGWSDIEPLKDYGAFQGKLRDLILGYEHKYPGASHKCISGEYDRDSVGRNPTHRACWDVATQLLQEFPQGWPASRQLWDFRFYRTYTYYNPPPRRSAQFIRALPQFLPYKQRALDQYKRWDPSKGELAWGYHSVKALIDAAYYDPHVYLDMLDNDPTNPENLRNNKGKGRMGGVKGDGRMEIVDGAVGGEKEEEHGMFPGIWKSSRVVNANKMQLEEEEHQSQAQDQDLDLDLDNDLMGLHRKVPSTSTDDNSSAPAVPYPDTDETKWDEKEKDMRLQILKAYDDAAQRPEGKEYHDSIRTMAGSAM